MKLGPYLYLRSSTFYFRRSIPLKLRPLLGRRELIHPVGKNSTQARLLASKLAILSDQLFQKCTPQTAPMLDRQYKDFVRALCDRMGHEVLNRFDEYLALEPELAERMKALRSLPNDSPYSAELLERLGEDGNPIEFLADRSYEKLLQAPDTPDSLKTLLENPERAAFFKRQLKVTISRSLSQLDDIEQNGLPTSDTFSQEILTNSHSEDRTTPPQTDQDLLSIAWKKYCQEKAAGWSARTAQQYESRMQELFSNDLLGDIPVNQVTREHILGYRAVLARLPNKRASSKRYRNKSTSELIAMNLKQEELTSNKTINERLSLLSSFMDWCTQHYDLPNGNPVKKLKLKTPAKKARIAYTNDEIATLFDPKTLIPHCQHYPSRFWVPLIALYSGARQAEICQLEYKSIIKDNKGHHAFAISSSEGKTLKTESARRELPIHPALIELGLLEYATTISKAGYTRLFPDIPSNLSRPGQKLSNWFTNYRRTTGITDRDHLDRKRDF